MANLEKIVNSTDTGLWSYLKFFTFAKRVFFEFFKFGYFLWWDEIYAIMHWKALNIFYNCEILCYSAILNFRDMWKCCSQKWAKCREFREKSTIFTISKLKMYLLKWTLWSLCKPFHGLLNAICGKLNTWVFLAKSEF